MADNVMARETPGEPKKNTELTSTKLVDLGSTMKKMKLGGTGKQVKFRNIEFVRYAEPAPKRLDTTSTMPLRAAHCTSIIDEVFRNILQENIRNSFTLHLEGRTFELWEGSLEDGTQLISHQLNFSSANMIPTKVGLSGGFGSSVIFSGVCLPPSSEHDEGMWRVNSASGQLTLNKAILNFEDRNEYGVELKVRDIGRKASPSLEAYGYVRVLVKDVAEAPTFGIALPAEPNIRLLLPRVQSLNRNLLQPRPFSAVAPTYLFAIMTVAMRT